MYNLNNIKVIKFFRSLTNQEELSRTSLILNQDARFLRIDNTQVSTSISGEEIDIDFQKMFNSMNFGYRSQLAEINHANSITISKLDIESTVTMGS